MTEQDVSDQLLRHVGGLRRYALALTGGQQEAEDLVQDTLLRAIAAAGSFRRGGNLRAWLFSIMHNAFISGVRRRGPRLVELDDEIVAPASGQAQLIRLELRDAMSALARLPEPQRAAVSLIALEEFSYEEAARVLDVPLGTLMSRLARGREALRQMTRDEPRRSLRLVEASKAGAKR
jgi:RNA polymerase sigma-70 factor (ECF subfamily)